MQILDTPEEKYFLYAGFWRRFVAAFIDTVVLSIFFIVLKFLFRSEDRNVSITFIQDMTPLTDMPSTRDNIIYFIICLIYFAGMESSKYMATIGKIIVDVKVVDTDGNKLTSQKAIVRYLGKILSAIILLIGYIMAAFDSKKQALHDKIAKTYVIKNN